MIRIEDFQDFNYVSIAFDIRSVDIDALKCALSKDLVNKLYRIDGADYIAIWNSDLQDFVCIDDIYFDSWSDDYVLAKLVLIGDEWYYEVIDANMKVKEDVSMN